LLNHETTLRFTILIDQRRKIAAYAVEKADEAIKKMPRQKWNYIVKAEVLRNIQGDYSEIAEQQGKTSLLLGNDLFFQDIRLPFPL
jgi:Zn-finger domain-containing protein